MSSLPFEKITVLGAGSWGTALAVFLAARGGRVTLWGHDPAHIRLLRDTATNHKYLPGVALPAGVEPVSSLDAASDSDLVVFVTPSRGVREVAGRLATSARLAPGAVLLSCTKGIEFGTGRRMSEILSEILPAHEAAVLSGPSHAEEVARHSPTALVLGAPRPETAVRLQTLFNAGALRAYSHDDVPGIELGGALKNIFAIAAGVSDGLGFGDNAKAALVTRSLAELIRLGSRLGGRRETFQGLSGIGDLMVTCFSRHSRNRAVGERLGRGVDGQHARVDRPHDAQRLRLCAHPRPGYARHRRGSRGSLRRPLPGGSPAQPLWPRTPARNGGRINFTPFVPCSAQPARDRRVYR